SVIGSRRKVTSTWLHRSTVVAANSIANRKAIKRGGKAHLLPGTELHSGLSEVRPSPPKAAVANPPDATPLARIVKIAYFSCLPPSIPGVSNRTGLPLSEATRGKWPTPQSAQTPFAAHALLHINRSR